MLSSRFWLQSIWKCFIWEIMMQNKLLGIIFDHQIPRKLPYMQRIIDYTDQYIYYRLFPDICSSIANEKQPMLMCGHLINQSSAPDPLVSLSACHNICSKSETCCFRVSQPPVLNRLVSCLCVLLSTLPTFSCLIVRPLNDTNSCIAGTLTSNTLFKNGIAAKWHTQRNKKKSGYYGFYQLFF